MTTIKERFEEEYKKGAFLYPNLGQPNWGGVLAFFRQELLALAEAVEAIERSIQTQHKIGFNAAIDKAAALIRAKANELSDPNQQQ